MKGDSLWRTAQHTTSRWAFPRKVLLSLKLDCREIFVQQTLHIGRAGYKDGWKRLRSHHRRGLVRGLINQEQKIQSHTVWDTDMQADLAQADEEVKDVSIVVEDSARLHIGPELRLALGVQSLVEVHLPLVKGVLTQQDRPAGHGYIIGMHMHGFARPLAYRAS